MHGPNGERTQNLFGERRRMIFLNLVIVDQLSVAVFYDSPDFFMKPSNGKRNEHEKVLRTRWRNFYFQLLFFTFSPSFPVYL